MYQPFTTTDLLNWKHYTPYFMEKPQATTFSITKDQVKSHEVSRAFTL
jgi:hypothetical protein